MVPGHLRATGSPPVRVLDIPGRPPVIPLAIIAADAVTTAVGLALGAEEANGAISWMPGWVIVWLGIGASLCLAWQLTRPARPWLRPVAMVWLAIKGAVVASNLAVLAGMA